MAGFAFGTLEEDKSRSEPPDFAADSDLADLKLEVAGAWLVRCCSGSMMLEVDNAQRGDTLEVLAWLSLEFERGFECCRYMPRQLRDFRSAVEGECRREIVGTVKWEVALASCESWQCQG